MATQTTEPSERDDTERSSTIAAPDADSTNRSLPAMAIEQVKNGRLPLLVGGVMAVSGIRGLFSEHGRGLARTVAGLALLGVGLRRRSKAGTDSEAMTDTENSLPGSETVSRRSESNVPDHNPRDVDDDPDVATAEDSAEGDVQFESDRDDVDVEQKPHLDDTDSKDPRYPGEGDPETDDDDPVEVDVSESALADEPNEAVGPDEEQAYPASEGTDPEPSAPNSPERSGEAGDTDSDVEDAEEASDTGRTSVADDATAAEDADDDIDESI